MTSGDDFGPLVIFFAVLIAVTVGLIVYGTQIQYNFAVECVRNGGAAIDNNCLVDGQLTK